MTKEANKLKLQADVIEKTLASFGITARTIEINPLDNETEFCIEVVLGVNIKEIESLDTTLAMALASPGKVKVQAPIPGRPLVGLRVPAPFKKGLKGKDRRVVYKVIRKTEEKVIDKTWWRNITFVLGNIFDLLRELFEKIARFFWKFS